ncbi:MAG: D-glycero-beta-D-manno-heptose-7-phosphate kinase [Caulobacterales bacterium]|jgi:D-beta-D-heptose 7-phosphate kinase/D-beta-D-heptose 1-phosphate adenosyltransferase
MSAPLTARFAGASVAVIGDVMLDHYVYGRVTRLAPEAPTPVLHVHSERHVLGGAANVAANIAALGGQALLVGVIGADAAGDIFTRQISALAGVQADLIIDPARPTILKTRYLGGQYQLVRVDRESAAAIANKVTEQTLNAARHAIAAADIVVLSDYGKGLLSDEVLAALFTAAKAHNKPVIVDPKRARFGDYRGASLITPNRKELSAAVGLACETDDEAATAAAEAQALSGAEILLTRSEKGMALYRAGEAPLHLKAEAREVFDVSGAGDTVVGAYALSLAAGLSAGEALQIANAAAGVVVQKLGTATVSPDELAAALAQGERAARVIVTPRAQALAHRAQWAADGLSVGFANGCFDLLHPGHIALVAQAAAACDRLIVALNSDASVARLKGPTRPIQSLEARAQVIGALKGVDLVVAFDDDTPLDLISALKPDVLVKGADYREDQVVGAEIVKAHGGRVLLAALTPGQSTSAIVAKSKT